MRSWRATLTKTVEQLAAEKPAYRLAVVGMGHELRGDDAAGVIASRMLERLQQSMAGRLKVINGGAAPENHTLALRRFGPDLVLFIDAADLGDPPGTIKWLYWEETTGLSASTHSLPIHLLARYLASELGCSVALLGIQHESTELGAPLSLPVRSAIEEIVEAIVAAVVPVP